jgi:hypothetical protein
LCAIASAAEPSGFAITPGIALGLTYGITPGMLPSMTAEKVKENRLRRAAERQGLQLMKSRRRDPRALDFGTYKLVDPATNSVTASGLPSGYGLSLDDVERELG